MPHLLSIRLLRWTCAILVTIGMSACTMHTIDRDLLAPTYLHDLRPADAGTIKVHLRDGSVLVLPTWTYDESTDEIRGSGEHWDALRREKTDGPISVSMDEVVLIETNRVLRSQRLVAVAILGGISTALTIHCLSQPKACFGSCPTFYLEGDDVPRAEGFSSSIAPSLERTDVDDLGEHRITGGRLLLTMRNEALETHVVRHVDLLAFPAAERGAEILAGTDGRYYRAADATPPGDCSGRDWASESVAPPSVQEAELAWCRALAAKDGDWRSVPADSVDLTTKEDFFVTFDAAPAGSLGLVVSARQSLLTTYVFYQTLTWMGTQAGTWLAALERGDTIRESPLGTILGRIEIAVSDTRGGWIPVGTCGETGPLATDTWCLPLSPPPGVVWDPTHFRLRSTRGLYRLDRVALARIEDAGSPIRLQPTQVWSETGADPDALAELLDPLDALVTVAGTSHTLEFDVPPELGSRCSLFLESRGYYLEWMRREWEEGEDPQKLLQLLWQPRAALRAMTADYKRNEAGMESMFWASRYVAP
ncbi:MAG: hypothetical protein KC729_04805 [Candidatus Eisenbacteria bacterium]|uniref:Uncharacterized protein n=1 Tax=Eiseniibacteriota bacterium TaxID=2212470 RepID=A0A956LZI2_UNCEI|nr:hypothetical protein [Candidatus Eisenbacteria bacterium]